MKELTIEEKAQRYDEAIERANSLLSSNELGNAWIYKLLPELKESEDERIRKELVQYLKDAKKIYSEGSVMEATINGFISYLEKQGEQKSTDKVEPKFKVGDWVVYNRNDNDCSREIMQIYDIRDNRYYFTDNIHFSWSIKECDEKSHLWTIQDAKDGDVLATKDTVFIFKHIDKTGRSLCKSYCEVIGNSELGLGFDFSINDVYPATIEQRDKLFAKMRKAGYEWNADKKELMKIEQNLTVTDEELAKAKKDAYNDALDKNEYHSGEPTFDDGWSAAIWYLKKRNSLPQNTWKPSATDIKALEDVIDLHVNPINYHATLHSILEQLKKLREG